MPVWRDILPARKSSLNDTAVCFHSEHDRVSPVRAGVRSGPASPGSDFKSEPSALSPGPSARTGSPALGWVGPRRRSAKLPRSAELPFPVRLQPRSERIQDTALANNCNSPFWREKFEFGSIRSRKVRYFIRFENNF